MISLIRLNQLNEVMFNEKIIQIVIIAGGNNDFNNVRSKCSRYK